MKVGRKEIPLSMGQSDVAFKAADIIASKSPFRENTHGAYYGLRMPKTGKLGSICVM